MKEIENFISTYNDYLKEKIKLFNDVELILKRNDLNPSSYENPILYFLEAFKFPTVYNYSGFCFINRPTPISKNLVHFATHIDYNMLYVYCFDDGKVYLWDEEYNRLEWYCSEGLPIFFESMCLVIQTKIEMLRTGSWDLNQGYLKKIFHHCLELNGGKEKYEIFYNHILGIDDNTNEF